MDSMKNKTKVYLLIFSLIMSLMGVAFFRSTQGSTKAHKSMTPAQELSALDKGATSPEMHKFLQHQQAGQEANDEAYRDLSGK